MEAPGKDGGLRGNSAGRRALAELATPTTPALAWGSIPAQAGDWTPERAAAAGNYREARTKAASQGTAGM